MDIERMNHYESKDEEEHNCEGGGGKTHIAFSRL